MQRTGNFSIQRKLILMVLCTSFLGLGIVCAAFEIYERASFRRGLREELTALADTVGANSVASLAFDDQKSAQEVLAALHAEPHVIAASLYQSSGAILADYRRPGVPTARPLPVWEEDGARFSADELILHRSIFAGREKIGGIAIVSDLTALQAKIREYTKITALVLLISILVTWFVASRLLGLITEPILQLAKVAEKVSRDKNYALRATPQSDDEVGRLIHSFNQMLERIQERDRKLQEAKDDLEVRVEARTKELQLEVHERIRAEETLAGERKVLRTLIDNVPDFIYVKDAESRFVVANASLAQSMGVESPDDLLGKTDFDFYPRELAEGYYRDEQEVIASKRALFNREEACFDAQGKRIWLLTTKVPLHDKNGRVTGIAGVGRDITKRLEAESEKQKAEEALSEERKVLRALIDNVPDFIYVKDTESRYVLANASLARWTGVKEPEELIQKSVFDVYPKELASAYHQDDLNVIQTKQALFNREEECIDAQGRRIWLLTTKVPLLDKNGRVTGIAGV